MPVAHVEILRSPDTGLTVEPHAHYEQIGRGQSPVWIVDFVKTAAGAAPGVPIDKMAFYLQVPPASEIDTRRYCLVELMIVRVPMVLGPPRNVPSVISPKFQPLLQPVGHRDITIPRVGTL